jgi:hypothetical protein
MASRKSRVAVTILTAALIALSVCIVPSAVAKPSPSRTLRFTVVKRTAHFDVVKGHHLRFAVKDDARTVVVNGRDRYRVVRRTHRYIVLELVSRSRAGTPTIVSPNSGEFALGESTVIRWKTSVAASTGYYSVSLRSTISGTTASLTTSRISAHRTVTSYSAPWSITQAPGTYSLRVSYRSPSGNLISSDVSNGALAIAPDPTATPIPSPTPTLTPTPVPPTALNVRDYGATGNGTTDDTAAVQSAITAAAAGGGIVYFPAGTYLVQPLTVPGGVVLQGVNGQGYYNAASTVANVNPLSRLRLKPGSAGPLISPCDGGTNLATHVHIFDLTLDCNGLNEPAISLPDQDNSISRFWIVERCCAVNSGQSGSGFAVYIGNLNTACTMRDCVVFGGMSASQGGNDGVGWYGQDGLVEDCYIGYFSDIGLDILGGTSCMTFTVRGGDVSNCTTGVVVGGRSSIIDGVSIEHNSADGIYFGYGPCTVSDCNFSTNSQAVANENSDIAIGRANQTIAIVDNTEAGGNRAKYFINDGATGTVLYQSGNVVDPGATFGTGFTNYAGPAAQNPTATPTTTPTITPTPALTPVLAPALMFNVTDYGATGNGTTDDTAAIQSAITAAAAGGGMVYFPAGTYLVQPLTVPAGVVLQGVNGQGYYNATTTVPNINTLSRLKLKSGSAGPLISPRDDGTDLAANVHIFDLALDCSGLTEPAINLPDQYASVSRLWTVERCYIVDVGGDTGFATYVGYNNSGVVFRDCVWFDGTSGSPAGHDAVGWRGPDGLMGDCFIGYWGGTGLDILGGASNSNFTIRGGGVFTCTTGIVVGGAGTSIDGVSVDHNYNDGIDFDCGPSSVSNCSFHTNSRAMTNTWSDIRIATPDQTITIFANQHEVESPEAGDNVVKYFIADDTTGTVAYQYGNMVAPGATFGTGFTNCAGSRRPVASRLQQRSGLMPTPTSAGVSERDHDGL